MDSPKETCFGKGEKVRERVCRFERVEATPTTSNTQSPLVIGQRRSTGFQRTDLAQQRNTQQYNPKGDTTKERNRLKGGKAKSKPKEPKMTKAMLLSPPIQKPNRGERQIERELT